MKKKIFLLVGWSLLCSCLLTSCYVYSNVVGTGSRGTEEVTQWNNYFLFGLIPGGISDSKAMAGGATNYTVKTRQTFVNFLVYSVTFGIYSPTTTTVSK